LKGQNFEFIPFGGGRKGCLGSTFAVATMEYLLANLLFWFDWRLPTINAQGEDLDMTEVNALTVFRKKSSPSCTNTTLFLIYSI